MADNIPVPPGSGTDPAVATDDIGSVHYQKVKIALGAENEFDTLVDSGQQTMANSVPVVIASNQTPIPVSGSFAESTAATATLTTPAMTTASATLLAANTNRLGAFVYNPLGADLLVRLGGDAAAAQIVRLPPRQTWEVPKRYTGALTGALVAGSGNANVTELTA